jgi:hypothetical protein
MDWELAIPLALAIDFIGLLFFLVVRPGIAARFPRQVPWETGSARSQPAHPPSSDTDRPLPPAGHG